MAVNVGKEELKLVSLGMRAIGDGFFQCIGMSLTHADNYSAKKLKQAFPKDWDKYRSIGLALKESQQRRYSND